MPQLDKKIAWEKWRDPYLFEEELSELQETLSQLNEEEDDMYQEFADELEENTPTL